MADAHAADAADAVVGKIRANGRGGIGTLAGHNPQVASGRSAAGLCRTVGIQPAEVDVPFVLRDPLPAASARSHPCPQQSDGVRPK